MYFPSAGVIDPDGAGDDDIESGRQSVSKKKQTRLSDVEVVTTPNFTNIVSGWYSR
jgi:hypothetical protein